MKIMVILLLASIIIPLASAHTETVKASGHPDWAPTMYRSGDSIVGDAPDIVAKVFKDLSLPVNCSYVGSWDQVQALGAEGRLDVIVAAYKTEDRERFFLYSNPYLTDNISAFMVSDFTYSSPNDLLGKNIAVTSGDSYGQEIDNFLRDNKGQLRVSSYETPEQAFASLINKKNDIFLYSLVAGEKVIKSNPDFKDIKNVVIGKELFYILISKKSKYAELMPQINNLLQIYGNIGEIKSI